MTLGVLIGYFALMLLIGWLVDKYLIKTAQDYWIGGRSLGFLVSWGTVMATFVSGATMLGYMSTYYSKGGFASAWMLLGTFSGWFLILVFFVHKVRRTNFVTMGDLFEDRYGPHARLLAVVIILYVQIGYMCIQSIGMGTALSVILGWPINIGIFVGSAVTVAYTLMGGYLAVAWTDLIQGLLILVSTMLAVPMALNLVGGFAGLREGLLANAPFFYDTTANGAFGLSYASKMVLMFGLANYAYPALFVRLYSAKDEYTARNSYLLTGVVLLLFYISAYVLMGCVRLLMPQIDPKMVDAIWPLAVKSLFPPLASGIFLAAIVAAVMSTSDSVLHVAGTTVARDLYYRMNPNASEKTLVSVSRWSILIIGLIGMGLSLMRPAAMFTITVFVWTYITVGLALPLMAAFYWKRATQTGAIASSVCGMLVTLVWFLLKKPFGVDEFYPGLLAALLGLIIGSLVTAPPPESIVDRYFAPGMSFRRPPSESPFEGGA